MPDLRLWAWPWLPVLLVRWLPAIPAVYVVRSWRGRVLYVGMSGNLRQRWSGPTPHHRFGQVWWGRIAWQELPPWWTRREILAYESYLIRRLRPALNYTRVHGR
jgi:excinuclease UvrABC nuclease subunit